MKPGSQTPVWVYAAIVMGAIVSLISVSYRFRMEHKNRAVGLVLEMQAVHDAAAAEGKSVSSVLSGAKKHGLIAVTLSEETLPELVETGEIAFIAPHVITGSKTALERVQSGLYARFGAGASRISGDKLVIEVPNNQFPMLSVGIDPQDAKAARATGLIVIARHGNAPGATSSYIFASLKRSRSLGATIYLPEGDQVLGQRKLLKEVTDDLKVLGMTYAAPEFVKISGDTSLAELNRENLIRLHSIQAAEADRMSPGEIEDRFVRAFRERNIRLLLLRPLSQASESPVASLYGILDLIRGGVEKEGGRAAAPKPFVDTQVPQILFVLIGLASAAVGIWVGVNLVSIRWLQYVGIGVLTLIALACWTAPGRLYMATVTAMIFPIAAYLILLGQHRINVLKDYVMMSAVSFTGGLCVAGLLNELAYFIRVDQFFAVKLAHFGPIVVIGWILLRQRFDFRKLLRSPMYWGPAAVGLLILLALGFMLARTGNDNPAAVSDLELRFRGILDAILYTRPRTKEFLIGNPALYLGLCLFALSKRMPDESDPASRASERSGGWAALFLTLGAIGQTSIVNTMCHAHTPIDLSVSRIVIGLIVGGILGAILWAALRGKLRPHRVVES